MEYNKYEELLEIVKRNNSIYEELITSYNKTNLNILDFEKKNKVNSTKNLIEYIDFLKKESERKKFDRWQHIHNYATEIQDFILNNYRDLNYFDVSILDLVPYTVYAKLTDKTVRIIKTIYQKEK